MPFRRFVISLSLALAVVAGLAAALPVVAGTGRGVLVVLFMGATGAAVGAKAAPSKSAPEPAGEPLPVPGQESVEKTADQSEADHGTSAQEAAAREAAAKEAAAKKRSVRTYSVRVGDSLSGIAVEQNVSGGWRELYADNREVIGADPSLIRPGLKLALGGEGVGTAVPERSSALASSRSGSSPKASSADRPDVTERARVAVPKSSSVATRSRPESPSEASSAVKPAAAQGAGKATAEVGTAGTAHGFTAPVSGVSLGTGYEAGGSLWSSGHHTGVDFLAATGTPVKAVGAGTVVSAGWGGAYGNQIIIQLADGHYAQYAHLSSLLVSGGQAVTLGQQVGLSGATGNVTGPHLHFEIRTTPDYGSDIDPVAYLRSKGVSVG